MPPKKRKVSRETRDVPVHTRLSEAEVAVLDVYAAAHTWSRSTAVQVLLRGALDAQKAG